MPDLPVPVCWTILGLGLGVGAVLSRVGGSKILGQGQVGQLRARQTSWVKRRTRSRSTDSRDVASAVRMPKALARATSLESVLRRLLVTL